MIQEEAGRERKREEIRHQKVYKPFFDEAYRRHHRIIGVITSFSHHRDRHRKARVSGACWVGDSGEGYVRVKGHGGGCDCWGKKKKKKKKKKKNPKKKKKECA